ncbi:MAG: SufD family Fe-S cluster assembly protein [Sulfurimonas sp.]
MEDKKLDNSMLDALRNVGLTDEKDTGSSFLASNKNVVKSTNPNDDLELLPIDIALEKYEWLKEKLFSLVPKDKDEYVKQVYENQNKLGYFIRVKEGKNIILPVQTCYLINNSDFTQMTHNIVICEKNSQLHLISGCTSNAHIKNGKHLGVSEYFLEEGSLLTTTMIHSWGSEVEVYPRSAAKIGKNAKFVSNYIAMSKVKKIQMNPTAYIDEGGLGEFYSVVYAPKGSTLDLGSEAVLQGSGAVANIVSRSVADGGDIIVRGKITGDKAGAKGTMSCNGLMLDKSQIHAIPELVANDPNLELSHEASVGMISEEMLAYLMASGISEDDARNLVVEGFLDLKIPGLPEYLQYKIDDMVKHTQSSSMI